MDLQPSPFSERRPSVRASAPEPSQRVGDLERASACDALADHYAAGRLDPAELDDRLARALAARSQDDLRVLFADLAPRRTPPRATLEPAAVPRPPGDAVVPLLTSVVILCLLLAGGMLLVLGAYHPGLFVAALVGGTATAVVGGCATTMWRAVTQRR